MAACLSWSSGGRSSCYRLRTRSPIPRPSCSSRTSAPPASSRASTTSCWIRASRPTTSTMSSTRPRRPTRIDCHGSRRTPRSPGRSTGAKLSSTRIPTSPMPNTTAARWPSVTTASCISQPESISCLSCRRISRVREARSTESTRTGPSQPTIPSTTGPGRTGTRYGQGACGTRSAPTTTLRPEDSSWATSAATWRRPRSRNWRSVHEAPTTAGRAARGRARRPARARSTPTLITAGMGRSPPGSCTTGHSSPPPIEGVSSSRTTPRTGSSA